MSYCISMNVIAVSFKAPFSPEQLRLLKARQVETNPNRYICMEHMGTEHYTLEPHEHGLVCPDCKTVMLWAPYELGEKEKAAIEKKKADRWPGKEKPKAE